MGGFPTERAFRNRRASADVHDGTDGRPVMERIERTIRNNISILLALLHLLLRWCAVLAKRDNAKQSLRMGTPQLMGKPSRTYHAVTQDQVIPDDRDRSGRK